MMAILLLAAGSVNTIAQYTGKPVVISGHLSDTLHADTVTLSVWDHYLSTNKQVFMPHRTFHAVLRKGHFQFHVPGVEQSVYFTLSYAPERLQRPSEPLSLYLACPGDSVQVQIAPITPVMGRFAEDTADRIVMLQVGAISFSGRSAAAYQCQYALMQAKKAFQKMIDDKAAGAPLRTNWKDTGGIGANYTAFKVLQEKLLTEKLVILQQYRSRLAPVLYEQLLADVQGEYYSDRLIALQYAYMEVKQSTGCTDSAARQLLLPVYREEETGFKVPAVAAETLADSRQYLGFMVLKARMDHRLLQLYADPVEYLFKAPEGLLRDKAIALYFTDYARGMKQPELLLDQAMKLVKDSRSAKLLDSIRRESGKGAPAFNFSLPDSSGRMVRLSDFAGKLVFIDFWYTGCAACSGFYRGSLSKVEKLFENNKDIVFLTVCIDKEKEGWMKSVRGGLYTSAQEPNVINLYTNGESIFHPLIKHYQIIGYPHQMLIDRKGRMYRSSDLQHSSEVLIPIIKEALAVQ
jgi:cytochrome oxidase Cu insertion factor (SCO1/SenC/PrrC family)